MSKYYFLLIFFLISSFFVVFLPSTSFAQVTFCGDNPRGDLLGEVTGADDNTLCTQTYRETFCFLKYPLGRNNFRYDCYAQLSTCNTSVTLENLSPCGKAYDYDYAPAFSCKSGYVCIDPDQQLCKIKFLYPDYTYAQCQKSKVIQQSSCQITANLPFSNDADAVVTLSGIKRRSYRFYVYDQNNNTIRNFSRTIDVDPNNKDALMSPVVNLEKFLAGTYILKVVKDCHVSPGCEETSQCPTFSFEVKAKPVIPRGSGATVAPGTTGHGGAGALCYLDTGKPVENPNELSIKSHPENIGILTAIGCVPTEPTQFILAVSRLATGMGGGIALLLMIVGAFKMITSAGNPDRVKEGSEQITSAIIGLLFIIFAVLLLKVIGVDILALPGFEP